MKERFSIKCENFYSLELYCSFTSLRCIYGTSHFCQKQLDLVDLFDCTPAPPAITSEQVSRNLNHADMKKTKKVVAIERVCSENLVQNYSIYWISKGRITPSQRITSHYQVL